MVQAFDENVSTHDDAPPRLVRPRREAVQLLLNHLKVGQAIAAQRMVYVDDLQQARREKQEWVTRTAELLGDLFGDSEIVVKYNDWVGPILPEYASVDVFIEQFSKEMKHRLSRLQALAKRINETPEAPANPVPATKIANTTEEKPMVAPKTTERTASTTIAGRQTGLLVVQGGDDRSRQGVAEFLAALDLSMHVVDQRSPEKRPLSDSLEPFDCEAFAIVLSEAGAGDADAVFDLGCCVGRFGSRGVCVLHSAANAPAEHVRGIRCMGLDAGGGWQLHLARHLKAGGAVIDLNRLM